jgi:hypothetical protein
MAAHRSTRQNPCAEVLDAFAGSLMAVMASATAFRASSGNPTSGNLTAGFMNPNRLMPYFKVATGASEAISAPIAARPAEALREACKLPVVQPWWIWRH